MAGLCLALKSLGSKREKLASVWAVCLIGLHSVYKRPFLWSRLLRWDAFMLGVMASLKDSHVALCAVHNRRLAYRLHGAQLSWEGLGLRRFHIEEQMKRRG